MISIRIIKMKTILLVCMLCCFALQQSQTRKLNSSTPKIIVDYNKTEYSTKFTASCNGSTTLTINTSSIISVSLNGVNLVKMKDSIQFDLSPLKCGQNSLIMVAANKKVNVAAALSFSILQDQQSCFICPTFKGFYSNKTCQCQCDANRKYGCQIVRRYPKVIQICGCF